MKKSMIGLGVLGIGVIVLTSATGPNLQASTNSREKSLIGETLSEKILNSLESLEQGTSESLSTTPSSTDTTTVSSEVSSTTATSTSQEETSTKSEETTEGSSSSVSSEEGSSESSSIPVEETSEGISSTEKDESTSVSSSSMERESSIEQSKEESREEPAKKEEGTVRPTIQLPKISDLLQTETAGTHNLSKDLKANQIAKDHLSGFELPLLSSYKNPHQGVLVYEGIKNVGIQGKKNDTLTFIENLYSKLINQKVEDLKQETIRSKDLLPGDILYVEIEGKYQLLGLYLGDSFYISIEEEQIENIEIKDKKETKYFSTIKKVFLQEKEDVQVRRGNQTGLTEYGKEVLADYPASFDFRPNFMTQRFIDKIGEDARQLGLEYDVFASVMIAQAILESGGGTSTLSNAPYNNLFGIKGGYEGSSVTFSTNEDRGNGHLFEIKSAFRTYPNTSSSLSDYVQLIRGGISGNSDFYEDSWRSNAQNYLRATHGLTGKYATDTYYHKKLNSIIAAYHLTAYDQQKNDETGIFIQGFESVPEEYRQLMSYPIYDGKDYNTSGSYPVGQCTWYGFNRVAQLGMKVDDFMGNGGEWGNSGRRLGYDVSSTPEAGTLISFIPGTAGSDIRYGHVAFVEAVGPNGILISEGNVYGGTTISYRVISNEIAHSNLVSYITPKS